ncbi:hypothetical protein B0G38_002172 [Arthrobacter sp. VKM Ac-2550]|nr:hypothetical protein [Arthrobacter sp. VKM Ac-2550]
MSPAGQRGQTPDVYPQQAGENFGFTVAKDREIGSQLLYGAVPLAQLDCQHGAVCGLGAHHRGGPDKAVLIQGLGQCFGPRLHGLPGGLDNGTVPPFHVFVALARKLRYGVRAGNAAQRTERSACYVKIVIAQLRLALSAEDVLAGRTAGAGGGIGHHLDLDEAATGQGIEVAADGSRREAEAIAELSGTDGTVFQDCAQHPVPGTLLGVRGLGARNSRVVHGIHNTIMT